MKYIPHIAIACLALVALGSAATLVVPDTPKRSFATSPDRTKVEIRWGEGSEADTMKAEGTQDKQ